MQNAKPRVAAVAARQRGRISRAQLLALGVSGSTITGWVRTGHLFRELPGVYAVGHPGRSEEPDLFAAILYAGPGAGLCGMTGGLWRGLVKWRIAHAIEVATPRRVRSLPADHPRNRLNRPVTVRRECHFRRTNPHGIPTVPIPHIVRDLAATGDLQLVRFVLAQLDFMRALNVPACTQCAARASPAAPSSAQRSAPISRSSPAPAARSRSSSSARARSRASRSPT